MTGTASPHSILPDDQGRSADAAHGMLLAGGVMQVPPAACARLLVAVAGAISARDADMAFAVSAGRGLWLPAGRGCELLSRSAVEVRLITFDRPVAGMPQASRLLDLPPLVQALAAEIGVGSRQCGGPAGRDAVLIALLAEKLVELRVLPGQGTLPRNPRLRRVCEAIIARPADDRGLDAWSREAGMARRTFTQSLRDETGMAFTSWRRQLRLAEATQRLAAGQPIGRVAHELGYQSSSAFTAMFRRTLGVPPRTYLRRA